jgi:asparagine synthase (glutamine-hydrolysing)
LGAPPSFAGYAQLAQGLAPSEQMRIWDFLSYLPDDLLVKIDRASMSASLEVRAPFLDHRVVEMAFAIPHHLLERNGVNKWILRRILDRYLPANLVDRPKSGFGVPLAEWLRGPLRDWAFDLLDSRKLKSQGYLDEAKVQRMLLAHQSGRFDRSFALWNVLMFQLWLNAETGPAYHLDRRAE